METQPRVDLPEDANNTLRFEFYLSKQPDKEWIKEYKIQMRNSLQDDNIVDQISINISDKHKNLCFGDIKFDHKMELEWLVVYGLIELSKVYHDLVIKVFDTDGDIILIEAAQHLPSWLESSNSKNRVFIHHGDIHIIPQQINLKDLHQKFSDPNMTISETAAWFIRIVNNAKISNDNKMAEFQDINTLADLEIQNAIKEQLAGLPDRDAWLSKKFKLLDEIVSGKRVEESQASMQKKFKESLTLNSIRAMNEDDLLISPFSSKASSSQVSTCSSDWVTEEEVCEDDKFGNKSTQYTPKSSSYDT